MRSRTRHTRSLDRVSKRVAWFLIALCAWTLYVWITRIVIIAGQKDNSGGFIAVHTTLGLISIAFGIAAGWIGYRALRPKRGDVPAARTEEPALKG
jgi:hypothetical protein